MLFVSLNFTLTWYVNQQCLMIASQFKVVLSLSNIINMIKYRSIGKVPDFHIRWLCFS